MVTVFRLKIDARICQWALPCDTTFVESGLLRLDGTPRRSGWDPPKFYIHNPIAPKTNFFIVAAGAFACDDVVLANSDLAMFLEMSGELLPIELESSERLYILNVTEVVNALDKETSRYRKNPMTGNPVALEHYAFHPYRFSQSSIFKIPETRGSEILTFSGRYGDPEDEFYTVYQKSGLTGLQFLELWKG